MQIIVYSESVHIFLTEDDTYKWANKKDGKWPCSTLSGRTLLANYDRHGLTDMLVKGGEEETVEDVDINELDAIIMDVLKDRIGPDHPCYDVCIGQFLDGKQ